MNAGHSASARIVHVLATKPREAGGGGEHLLRIIPGLLERGFRSAAVVGAEGPIAGQLRKTGVEVIVLGPMGLSAPLRLRRALAAMRPDLLHLHGSRAGLLGVIAAGRHAGYPIVYTAHAFSFRRSVIRPFRWMLARTEAFTCSRATYVICLSHADRADASRLRIPVFHSTVIPNGVDVSRFDGSDDRRAEFGFPPDAPVVGMVARLTPQKDPLAFIAVASRVAEREPAARFLLVGDGPMRSRAEQAIRGGGLHERVMLTGFRPDVPALLRTMDVAVLTSRWEGSPFAVLEAMAAGRPVVASSVPGIADAVLDGVTGFLIPAGDVEGFVSAVRRLLADRRTRVAMGGAGRERVLHQFSHRRMIELTAEAYASALHSLAAPAPHHHGYA